MNRLTKIYLAAIIIALAFFSPVAYFANSAGIQILDGTIAPGGYSTSSSFQLNSAISQISIGRSQTAGFNLAGGWLNFPILSTPVLTATAGDSQVVLSWTPVIGQLGWTVSGYSVGWSTNQSGPYSFVSVGSSNSYTKTSLTNDIAYYFLIKIKDAFSNDIATSTVISATPYRTIVIPPPSGGGGGGGGGITPPSTNNAQATFKGHTYPLSDVYLLKDGQIIGTTKAGPDAYFEITASNLSFGQYTFGINSIDDLGNQSLTQNFPVTLTSNASTIISGIFIAPSIALDKQQVKKGDNLIIFGHSAPESQVVININSDNEIFAKSMADKTGFYLYTLDTSPLELGDHTAKSKAITATEISLFSKTVAFTVGTNTVMATPAKKILKGDLNGDGKVNLVDFSIAAYWYKRQLTGAIIATEIEKLNGDGKIDLADFSIMAYYWTG